MGTARETTFVIAEAGVNHNGEMKLAMALVDAARESGADAVKFQTFKAEEVACVLTPLARYQEVNMPGRVENQLQMLKRLELSFSDFCDLHTYSKQRGIVFLSTPFDLESIDFLAQLRVPLLKVPSGEIVNYPYLRKIGRTGLPVLLSTGMATLKEVDWAMGVLRGAGSGEISLLHCVTDYPAIFDDVNLRAMLTMKEVFGCPVGYSDHTEGVLAPVAAVAMGATVIEKHLTLDQAMDGPDHKASLEPDEFKAMVASIRQVEQCLGNGKKQPTERELVNMPQARRSLVTAREIAQGEKIAEEALSAKRPGTGIPPSHWTEIIGRRALCTIPAGTFLSWDMVAEQG